MNKTTALQKVAHFHPPQPNPTHLRYDTERAPQFTQGLGCSVSSIYQDRSLNFTHPVQCLVVRYRGWVCSYNLEFKKLLYCWLSLTITL
jgi:hypothetical protein